MKKVYIITISVSFVLFMFTVLMVRVGVGYRDDYDCNSPSVNQLDRIITFIEADAINEKSIKSISIKRRMPVSVLNPLEIEMYRAGSAFLFTRRLHVWGEKTGADDIQLIENNVVDKLKEYHSYHITGKGTRENKFVLYSTSICFDEESGFGVVPSDFTMNAFKANKGRGQMYLEVLVVLDEKVIDWFRRYNMHRVRDSVYCYFSYTDRSRYIGAEIKRIGEL
ncbi:hypothetical protein FUAX_53600 (plasmid) [Fulvitalea axinellae]|uniref:Uncharacterized protein n=1 Tax=Fulvitalea axinellae TaxID=1182444 RepID=A0AAU9CS39_9BACT|nr:hypothetical protein FUAX_53600 [Fulvitalea axinellae]